VLLVSVETYSVFIGPWSKFDAEMSIGFSKIAGKYSVGVCFSRFRLAFVVL